MSSGRSLALPMRHTCRTLQKHNAHGIRTATLTRWFTLLFLLLQRNVADVPVSFAWTQFGCCLLAHATPHRNVLTHTKSETKRSTKKIVRCDARGGASEDSRVWGRIPSGRETGPGMRAVCGTVFGQDVYVWDAAPVVTQAGGAGVADSSKAERELKMDAHCFIV